MTLLQVPTPREWHRKMVEGKEVLTCKKWGVTTIRHILENQTYTLNGTLYPDEQVVIYDIGDVKPETEKKRRGRRKKSEIEAEQKEN